MSVSLRLLIYVLRVQNFAGEDFNCLFSSFQSWATYQLNITDNSKVNSADLCFNFVVKSTMHSSFLLVHWFLIVNLCNIFGGVRGGGGEGAYTQIRHRCEDSYRM